MILSICYWKVTFIFCSIKQKLLLFKGFCYLVVAQKRISQAQEDIDKKNERIQLNDSVLIQNYLKLSEKQPDVVQYDPSMNFHSLFPDSYAIKRLEIGAAFGDLSLLTNKRM